MHLDAIPDYAADLPAKALTELDAALDTIRSFCGELVSSDEIEFCQAMRAYFEIRVRAIESAAWERKKNPFGTLVPIADDTDKGGAA